MLNIIHAIFAKPSLKRKVEQNYKTPRRQHRRKPRWPWVRCDFLDTTPKAGSMKEIIDRMHFTKIKNFCSGKDTVKRMRKQATGWEKIFAEETFDKQLLTKTIQKFLRLSKKTTWLKNGPKPSPKIFRWQISIWEDAPHYITIRKTQIKIMRHYYKPIRTAKIQNTDNTKCWWEGGATGTLNHCWWESNVVQPLWKTDWWFPTEINTLLPSNSAINCAASYLPKGAEN